MTSADFTHFLNVRSAYGPSFSHSEDALTFITDVTGVAEAWRIPAPAHGADAHWPDQLTFDGARISRAVYAPTDDRLLLCSDVGGSELTQLYVLAPNAAGPEKIAGAPNAICEFGAWSPDGARIAYASNERDPRFFDIYERDLRTGESRIFALPDGTYMAESYAPDGRSLLVRRLKTLLQTQLLLLDCASGESRALTTDPDVEPALYASPAWSAGRRGLYLLSDRGQDFRQLAYLDLASGDLQMLTDAPWDAEALAVSGDGAHLALVTNEDGYSRLEFFDVSAGWEQRHALHVPDFGRCVLGDLTWSADGRRLALSRQSSVAPLDVWVIDVDTGEATRVTRSSLGGLTASSFVEPSLVHYPTFDGRRIPALLYAPAGEAQARPTIVYVHGGPESQYRPTFNPIVQYFVAHGYHVLAPNVRGSTGYGVRYRNLDDVRLRMDSVADLLHAAQWLILEQVAVANRIAVMGGSYGGFMTLAALTTYPELWAAGVDIVGIANFVTFLENTSAWRRALREAEYGSLEHDREFLTKISPLTHVERIVAPLFVAHGANDPRVPVGEAEQIVASLREHDRPVEYMRFEDEGHGIVKRINRLIVYPAIARFLDQHIG